MHWLHDKVKMYRLPIGVGPQAGVHLIRLCQLLDHKGNALQQWAEFLSFVRGEITEV
jgi:hypothetical protein